MRQWLSGFAAGFTVMSVAALWYRSQLRAMQEHQAAIDAFHDEMIADMEEDWDAVPTERKLRVYMKMAEDGILLEEDETDDDDKPPSRRKKPRKK